MNLPAQDLAPGEAFGAYKINKLLGRGGMGAVYEAVHRDDGRVVALKLLSVELDNMDSRQRFLREGQTAAAINHPNAVYIYGTEEINGVPVISMELVPGGNL
ncbi:MAG TPA: protein kinase, partial [Gemmatimonadaceae bacterium]|nr:protein kinase [Gemmatimonadaceae bacterium]